MAQICRVNKSEAPVLIRILSGNYRCYKRCLSNYYEILRISQDATQKEIKDAFIKLSKEMHPDCGNKGSHSDFVKLNEAHSVLSKKNSRHYYDITLKSDIKMNSNYVNQCNGVYTFYNLHKTQRAKRSKKEIRKIVGFCVALMIFGSMLQIIRAIAWSNYNRRSVYERNAKVELKYQSNRDQRRQLLESNKRKFNFHDK